MAYHQVRKGLPKHVQAESSRKCQERRKTHRIATDAFEDSFIHVHGMVSSSQSRRVPSFLRAPVRRKIVHFGVWPHGHRILVGIILEDLEASRGRKRRRPCASSPTLSRPVEMGPVCSSNSSSVSNVWNSQQDWDKNPPTFDMHKKYRFDWDLGPSIVHLADSEVQAARKKRRGRALGFDPRGSIFHHF